MSSSDKEFVGLNAASIQQKFFADDLVARGGRYEYVAKSLNAETGTVVLFQYEASIIARADFVRRETFSKPNDEYKGAMYFDVTSIKIFDPVDASKMREAWPEFSKFSQAMPSLSASHLADFEASLTNVIEPAAKEPATLNDYLRNAGINPGETLVFRHAFQKRLPKLNKVIHEIISDDPAVFDAWQQFHNEKTEQKLLKAKYVASFLADGSDRAVLVGIYENCAHTVMSKTEREEMEGWKRLMGFPDSKEDDDRDAVIHFDLKTTTTMAELKGRLVIHWDNPISWDRWAIENENVFEIVETLSESVFPVLPSTRPAPITEKLATNKQRIGQFKFRKGVTANWDGQCAVTGCGILPLLVASHVRPWRDSNDHDRTDPDNGLLLSANLDALFDRFYITFSEEGDMIISEEISSTDRKALGLTNNLKLRAPLSRKAGTFMAWHRERFRDCWKG